MPYDTQRAFYKNWELNYTKSKYMFIAKNKLFFFKVTSLRWYTTVPSFNPLFKTSREAFFWKLLQRILYYWNNLRICIKFFVTELLFNFTNNQKMNDARSELKGGMILILHLLRYCSAEVTTCGRALSWYDVQFSTSSWCFLSMCCNKIFKI